VHLASPFLYRLRRRRKSNSPARGPRGYHYKIKDEVQTEVREALATIAK
jgi:hypothetical protein